MLIVGEKEAANGKVSVRRQGEGDLGTFSIDEFAQLMTDKIKEELN
jgi:threonyl-tRNA synthetase